MVVPHPALVEAPGPPWLAWRHRLAGPAHRLFRKVVLASALAQPLLGPEGCPEGCSAVWSHKHTGSF